MLLSEFYLIHDKESWNGYSTAFKAGARAKLTGAPMRYARRDFQDAWFRGHNEMTAFLAGGGEVEDNSEAALKTRRRKVRRHMYGNPECDCEHCLDREKLVVIRIHVRHADRELIEKAALVGGRGEISEWCRSVLIPAAKKQVGGEGS